VEICPKEKCTGCGACYQKCPFNAITMKEDEEGFLVPIIDEKKCKKCNLCQKTCPNNKKIEKKESQKAYYFINNNSQKLKNSTSGGIFIELAESIIENNGIVFGCEINKNNEVIHSYTKNKEDLKKYQGSKYVQSNILETYKKAEEFLKQNKQVLYTGTPCQIMGLKSYLGKEYDNLITLDVVCHGVPSQLIFKKYIIKLEKKYSSQITNIKFRTKLKKGSFYTLAFNLKNKKNKQIIIPHPNLSSYYYGFLKNYTLRNSCYDCQYSNINRISDITLGDFWGAKKIHPNVESQNGISLILMNTEKGENFIKNIKIYNLMVETNIKLAAKENHNLLKSSIKNSAVRDNIYIDLNEKGYDYIEKKYLTPKYKILYYIKSLIPQNFKSKFTKK